MGFTAKAVPASMAERPIVTVNPNVFKKTDKEKIELRIAKNINKGKRKKEFGAEAHKHLNITSVSEKLKNLVG